MSQSRSLLPTITLSIGMLLGGLLGAAAGSVAGNEAVVILCYVVGVLGGATSGTMLGWRIQAKSPSRGMMHGSE